jgi:sulfoxide reductase heme-binding subunit YedZ
MWKRLLLRHTFVGIVALMFWAVFWFTHLDWDPEIRFWRAVGDASFMLLIFALVIGPMARLWSRTSQLLAWRREAGIWFGLLALGHTLLTLNGWIRWDVARFFGYEFIPELGRTARIEPGFGLANLIGIVALAWALVLTATSSDRASYRLGESRCTAALLSVA